MHALLPKSYTKGGWERIGGWISIVKGCAAVRRRVEGTSRGVHCCQEEGGGTGGCAVARRRVEGTCREVRCCQVDGTSRGVRCCQEEGGWYV